MRDERKEIEEIKIKIRLQTAITFDRILQLRRSTQPQKANDEIYRVNRLCSYRQFRSKKNLIFKLKNPCEVFFSVFS
jgi:hypothetical protein